ncbi:MAG: hypothetical protein Q4G00_16850 [Clostridia bacterium]|nr:hypothetical protein [Clostridia bacterium]
MRKSFVSLIANDRYQVGCTGQTVYVRDATGNELAKFKDMTYAYYPALHPNGEIAAVYSNNGIMAVYSLSELRLIKKFRVSAMDDTETDRIPLFSPDGKYLYHIEGRKGDSLNSRLSVYSTLDYQPVIRLFEQGSKLVLSRMEWDDKTNCLFLLGYFRKEEYNEQFIAKLIDQSLQDVRYPDDHVYDFYRDYIGLKQLGFTQHSYKWSGFAMMPIVKADLEKHLGHPVDMGPFNREYSLEDIKKMNLSLAQLWEETGEK